jgi:hypothetical protein
MTTATVEQQTTTETLENYRQRIDSLAHDLRLEGIKLEEDENALGKMRE